MNDKNRHQVAVGTGLGLTVIALFVPIVFPNMNLSVAIAGILLGILIFLWGMWPLFPHWTWWPSRMVPMNVASRLALEAIDGSVLAMQARRQSNAPNGALCFIATKMFTDGIPIYGRQIPSSKLLKLSDDLLFSNVFSETAVAAVDSYSHEVTFSDLAVKRRDLATAINKLKEKNKTPGGLSA